MQKSNPELFANDDLGRVVAQTERRHLLAGGTAGDFTTATSYFDGGEVRSVTTPYDAANNTGGTVYAQDVAGRETSVRLPDGSTRTTQYRDAEGATRVEGSQVYPSETVSDAFGQMVSLTTWRDYAAGQGSATTAWLYDAGTGLLAGKRYADGNGTDYTYDAAGRLATRRWARGIVTGYAYTPSGELASVTYSDGTPAVTNTYDRNGNLLASGSYAYSYAPATLLPESETHPVGGTPRTLRRERDGLLRDAGFSLLADGTFEAGATWGYDAAGRIASVSGSSALAAGAMGFAYQWADGRPDLIARVDGPAHVVENAWGPLRPALAAKLNRQTDALGGGALSRYGYGVNALGQRTSAHLAGAAFASGSTFYAYGYDGLGQVTSARRYAGGTPESPTDPVAGGQFGFGYDTIGNRKEAVSTGTTSYLANALNQYSSIARSGEPPTEPAYDPDGNMLNDGAKGYAWDGENRLVKVTLPGGIEVMNAYDGQSRRIRKTVKTSGTVTADTAYLYDGWNVVAEYEINQQSQISNLQCYLWGLDLSNTPQGAGGVGGLLARTTATGPHAYAYDGNGNVSELIDPSGSVAAHYEYGPFGEPLAATGPAGEANPYRWSTKPWDGEAGLSYYGHRFYEPVTGRWVAKDSAEEQGGANLYGFVHNNPVVYVDTDGRKTFNLPPIEIPWPKLPPIEIPWFNLPDFPWPKPKLPRINPPNAVRCGGYLPFVGSTCDGGKPDPYPAGAYKCCNDFMDLYKRSNKTQCAANCLQAAEVKCQTEESCCKRDDCRKQAHVDCYTKCGFFPVKGFPASCVAIGLTGL